MFENKYSDFFINLGTYRPKYVFTRFLFTSLSAAALIFIMGTMTGWENVSTQIRGYIYLLSVVAFNSIFEINLFILVLFKRWEYLRKNLFIQLFSVITLTIILTLIWLKVAEKIIGDHNLIRQRVTQIVLIIGLLILFIQLLIIILSNLTKEWMSNKKELNELKQAKLLNDYNQLKDRLNPHFLFNNLSVLKSLIHFNPDDAEIFTENFTNVYRYMLKCHDQKTVILQEEIKFLNAYIALHKERIGEGLIVNLNIDETDLTREIPPMALQLLVENAIKHNVANKRNPLTINIFSNNDSIIVENNINKKETTYSTHTGLSTLKAQYQFIANQSIHISNDANSFRVVLPLI